MLETEKAYYAGLFDGEGSYMISRIYKKYTNKKGETKLKSYFYPRVSMSLIDKNMIEEFREKFGGHVYLQKRYKEHHPQAYSWRISTLKELHNFFNLIGKYLRLKRSPTNMKVVPENRLDELKAKLPNFA